MLNKHDALRNHFDCSSNENSTEQAHVSEVAFSHAQALIQDMQKQTRRGIYHTLAATMLFDFSRAHASPQEASMGGIFWDPYTREGIILKKENGACLVHLACIEENPRAPSAILLYSYEMHPIVERLVQQNSRIPIIFHKVQDFEGYLIGQIEVDKKYSECLCKFLGSIGGLPPQESLIQRLIHLKINEEQVVPLFCKLLSFRHGKEFTYNGMLIKEGEREGGRFPRNTS